jgi:hypothetical protein
MVEYNIATAAFLTSSTTPKLPREADAYRWYLRMGYLGKEALERLISNVYGIKIRGSLTFNCQPCLQAKAKRQISRRQPGRISPRPFWRIRFNIFKLERAYNQLKYALII